MPTISTKFYERPCPQCEGEKSEVAFTAPDRQVGGVEQFSVSRCQNCGLWFQNPALKAEYLPEHYPPEYAPYGEIEMTLSPVTQWYLRNYLGYEHLASTGGVSWLRRVNARWLCGMQLFPRFVHGGSLLEVGCAAGNRLLLFKRLGWENCQGIEYSSEATATAKRRGLNVIAGPVEDTMASIPNGTLDVVVANFVMEHLTNPFEVVRLFASKLRSGGQLLFSTLNVDSPDFRLFRQHWYNLDLPRHMVFFRKRDLREMLRNDFHEVNFFSLPAPIDYVGSARYRLKESTEGMAYSLDRALDRWGTARLMNPITLLARLGISSRIAVSAIRS